MGIQGVGGLPQGVFALVLFGVFVAAAVGLTAHALIVASGNWTASRKATNVDSEVTRLGNATLFEKWDLFYASSSVLALWIIVGAVSAARSYWVPVPFFGYCRVDLAIAIITALELPLAYLIAKLIRLRRQQYAVVLFLLFALPALPDFIRPVITRGRHLTPYAGGSVIHTHENIGFTPNEAVELTRMVWKYSDMWTHISDAQGLAYFNFGSSINFDWYGRAKKGYTVAFGRELTAERMKCESEFRLNFPQDWKRVQLTLQENIASTLRPILAKSLHVNAEDVIFGNEIERSHLGQPGIGIFLPNLLWHWIINPHFDGTYANRIPRHIACAKSDQVTTFIIPIAAPAGAGLRYWTREGDGSIVMKDVLYRVGNVYTFLASSTLHAIRPFPYREWRRGSTRINLQAFGVQCDDSKWYIYH